VESGQLIEIGGEGAETDAITRTTGARLSDPKLQEFLKQYRAGNNAIRTRSAAWRTTPPRAVRSSAAMPSRIRRLQGLTLEDG
jgi:hypothetical protein